MAVKINWTHNSQVVNGPKVTGSGTVEADAYDNIEVTVPAKVGTTNGVLTVDVQPGAAGKVKFLLVKSDRYADLTYDIDADPDLAGIKLDAQLLLVGEGALAMAGGAPQTFKFTNAGSQAANVQILVARDATTP